MNLVRVMACSCVAVAIMAGLTGCNKGIKAERDRLFSENTDLRAENGDLQAALDACESDRGGMATQLAEARDANRQLERDLNDRPSGRVTGFENIPGVTGEAGVGEVTARVEGDVLFASGKVDLKSGSKQSLDQVASILNSNYSGRTIRIEGHTDDDPIRKSSWKTNDRLSAERAMAVKKYLESKGIDGNRMYVAGFGPNRPMGTKEQSRRVEIVVLLNK